MVKMVEKRRERRVKESVNNSIICILDFSSGIYKRGVRSVFFIRRLVYKDRRRVGITELKGLIKIIYLTEIAQPLIRSVV